MNRYVLNTSAARRLGVIGCHRMKVIIRRAVQRAVQKKEIIY